MEKKQTGLLLGGALIIFLLLLAIIFLPAQNEETINIDEESAGQNSTSTDSNLDTIIIGEDGVSETGDGNIEIVEIEKQEQLIAPILNRPISIPNYFPEDAKKLVATKIADTIASLEEDSSSFENWLNLGNLRNQIEDYEGAEEIYEYLTIVKSENSVPLVNVGNVNHYHLKDFAKAELSYLKAIELSPNEETAYMELHTMYKNVYKVETDSAEQILIDGLQAKPGSTNFMILLANYHKDKGEKEKQLEYLNQALDEATRTSDTALMERLNTEINSL